MDVNEILIEEVRTRTILYDVGHADYKNLKKKEYAWKEVSANVKLSEANCKKRWKGLRDSFKRCKRMQQVASGNSAETSKKKWKYFEDLSFLDSVTSSRRSVGNTYNDKEEYITDDIDLDSADSYLSPDSQCSTSTCKRKKKDSERFQEFVDFAASSITETCGTFAKQKEEEDSTALLFASLARKIKESNMPPNIKNRIEATVSALVFEELDTFYNNKAL